MIHHVRPNYQTLQAVTRLINGKQIRLDSVVEHVYDMSVQSIYDMHARIASKRTRGKLVLSFINECPDCDA